MSLNINFQMFEEGKPETIQVRSIQAPRHNYQIKSLQEAVTEKYGIPGEHLKFEYDPGSATMWNSDSDGYYLTGLDAHFSFELTETSQCRAGLRYTTLHVAILLYNE